LDVLKSLVTIGDVEVHNAVLENCVVCCPRRNGNLQDVRVKTCINPTPGFAQNPLQQEASEQKNEKESQSELCSWWNSQVLQEDKAALRCT
jgi:hypothetical protein